MNRPFRYLSTLIACNSLRFVTILSAVAESALGVITAPRRNQAVLCSPGLPGEFSFDSLTQF